MFVEHWGTKTQNASEFSLLFFHCNLQLVLSILWSNSNNLVGMLTEWCRSTLRWSMLSVIL